MLQALLDKYPSKQSGLTSGSQILNLSRRSYSTIATKYMKTMILLQFEKVEIMTKIFYYIQHLIFYSIYVDPDSRVQDHGNVGTLG